MRITNERLRISIDELVSLRYPFANWCRSAKGEKTLPQDPLSAYLKQPVSAQQRVMHGACVRQNGLSWPRSIQNLMTDTIHATANMVCAARRRIVTTIASKVRVRSARHAFEEAAFVAVSDGHCEYRRIGRLKKDGWRSGHQHRE